MHRTIRGKSASASNVTAPKPTPVREMRDDFLNAASASYLEAMEDEYRADPNSVPESWAALLRQLGAYSSLFSFVCVFVCVFGMEWKSSWVVLSLVNRAKGHAIDSRDN